MIKNVILDVGNVLVDYCWEKHLASFGFPADIAERVAKATALSEDWEEYDRGVLTDAEVLNRFIENDPGVEKEIRMYVENLSGVIEVYPYAEEWIRAMKAKGLHVYILSNYATDTLERTEDKLTFLKYVDGAVFSCQVKQIKPEPEIYKTLLHLQT